MQRWSPDNAELSVFTFKAGLLAPVGHDLKLAVTQFSASYDDTIGALHLSADPSSLRVLGALEASSQRPVGPDLAAYAQHLGTAVGDVRPGRLKAIERRKIEAAIVRDVLRVKRWPQIVFEASVPVGDLSTGAQGQPFAGQLELCGVQQRVAFYVQQAQGAFVARALVAQHDFKIRPYTAMFGALKVGSEILIELKGEIKAMGAGGSTPPHAS